MTKATIINPIVTKIFNFFDMVKDSKSKYLTLIDSFFET